MTPKPRHGCGRCAVYDAEIERLKHLVEAWGKSLAWRLRILDDEPHLPDNDSGGCGGSSDTQSATQPGGPLDQHGRQPSRQSSRRPLQKGQSSKRRSRQLQEGDHLENDGDQPTQQQQQQQQCQRNERQPPQHRSDASTFPFTSSLIQINEPTTFDITGGEPHIAQPNGDVTTPERSPAVSLSREPHLRNATSPACIPLIPMLDDSSEGTPMSELERHVDDNNDNNYSDKVIDLGSESSGEYQVAIEMTCDTSSTDTIVDGAAEVLDANNLSFDNENDNTGPKQDPNSNNNNNNNTNNKTVNRSGNTEARVMSNVFPPYSTLMQYASPYAKRRKLAAGSITKHTQSVPNSKFDEETSRHSNCATKRSLPRRPIASLKGGSLEFPGDSTSDNTLERQPLPHDVGNISPANSAAVDITYVGTMTHVDYQSIVSDVLKTHQPSSTQHQHVDDTDNSRNNNNNDNVDDNSHIGTATSGVDYDSLMNDVIENNTSCHGMSRLVAADMAADHQHKINRREEKKKQQSSPQFDKASNSLAASVASGDRRLARPSTDHELQPEEHLRQLQQNNDRNQPSTGQQLPLAETVCLADSCDSSIESKAQVGSAQAFPNIQIPSVTARSNPATQFLTPILALHDIAHQPSFRPTPSSAPRSTNTNEFGPGFKSPGKRTTDNSRASRNVSNSVKKESAALLKHLAYSGHKQKHTRPKTGRLATMLLKHRTATLSESDSESEEEDDTGLGTDTLKSNNMDDDDDDKGGGATSGGNYSSRTDNSSGRGSNGNNNDSNASNNTNNGYKNSSTDRDNSNARSNNRNNSGNNSNEFKNNNRAKATATWSIPTVSNDISSANPSGSATRHVDPNKAVRIEKTVSQVACGSPYLHPICTTLADTVHAEDDEESHSLLSYLASKVNDTGDKTNQSNSNNADDNYNNNNNHISSDSDKSRNNYDNNNEANHVNAHIHCEGCSKEVCATDRSFKFVCKHKCGTLHWHISCGYRTGLPVVRDGVFRPWSKCPKCPKEMDDHARDKNAGQNVTNGNDIVDSINKSSNSDDILKIDVDDDDDDDDDSCSSDDDIDASINGDDNYNSNSNNSNNRRVNSSKDNVRVSKPRCEGCGKKNLPAQSSFLCKQCGISNWHKSCAYRAGIRNFQWFRTYERKRGRLFASSKCPKCYDDSSSSTKQPTPAELLEGSKSVEQRRSSNSEPEGGVGSVKNKKDESFKSIVAYSIRCIGISNTYSMHDLNDSDTYNFNYQCEGCDEKLSSSDPIFKLVCKFCGVLNWHIICGYKDGVPGVKYSKCPKCCQSTMDDKGRCQTATRQEGRDEDTGNSKESPEMVIDSTQLTMATESSDCEIASSASEPEDTTDLPNLPGQIVKLPSRKLPPFSNNLSSTSSAQCLPPFVGGIATPSASSVQHEVHSVIQRLRKFSCRNSIEPVAPRVAHVPFGQPVFSSPWAPTAGVAERSRPSTAASDTATSTTVASTGKLFISKSTTGPGVGLSMATSLSRTVASMYSSGPSEGNWNKYSRVSRVRSMPNAVFSQPAAPAGPAHTNTFAPTTTGTIIGTPTAPPTMAPLELDKLMLQPAVSLVRMSDADIDSWLQGRKTTSVQCTSTIDTRRENVECTQGSTGITMPTQPSLETPGLPTSSPSSICATSTLPHSQSHPMLLGGIVPPACVSTGVVMDLINTVVDREGVPLPSSSESSNLVTSPSPVNSTAHHWQRRSLPYC